MRRCKNISSILMNRAFTITCCGMILMMAEAGCGPRLAKLPADYHVHWFSRDERFVSPMIYQEDTPIIPEKTVGLWWNERFIVGKVYPLTKKRYPDSDMMTANPDESCFYIIDTEKRIQIGPLNHQELLKESASLGLSLPKTLPSPPFTYMERT